MSYRTKNRSKYELPFHAMFHPGDAFDDLRFNHKNSLGMSLFCFFALVLLTVVQKQFTGIQMVMSDPNDVNIVQAFFLNGAVLVLFTVSNWAFCELVDGKAKMKDIWIITNYALLPYIVFGFVRVILSNFMTQDESVFLEVLTVVSVIWSLVVLISGFMTFHEFELFKTILSLFITVIGMALIVFLIFLLYSLFQQVSETIMTVFNEIIFRTRM